MDKKLCTICHSREPIISRLIRAMGKLPTQGLVPTRIYLGFAEQDEFCIAVGPRQPTLPGGVQLWPTTWAGVAIVPVCLANYLRIEGERLGSRPRPLRSARTVRALALA